METLKELKAIIAGKPEGATHIDVDRDYVKFIGDEMHHYSFVVGFDGWSGDYEAPCELRSLSDIERIIELMECNSNLKKSKYRGL
ncbi:hypothetical protein [Pseudoalteromonas phage XCL1123]|nr:hypothetical protein [Pseudoalteromonas phage XCL1123]